MSCPSEDNENYATTIFLAVLVGWCLFAMDVRSWCCHGNGGSAQLLLLRFYCGNVYTNGSDWELLMRKFVVHISILVSYSHFSKASI